MTIVIFISYWVKEELSYDKFYKNYDRIYRLTVEKNDVEKGYHTHFARSWYGWLKDIKKSIPEIEETAKFTIITWLGNIAMADNKPFQSIIIRTDSSFFNIFSLDFIIGKSKEIFTEPNQVILSEEAAKKYFGNQNPIDKTLIIYCTRCPEKKEHTVVAVVKDQPVNSHFHFDILATYDELDNYSGWAYNYILLRKEVSPEDVILKFHDFAKNYIDENEAKMLTPHLQKITDIHLHSNKLREIENNGNIKNVYLFSGISLFVFFIALFNYINLQSVNLLKNYQTLQVFKCNGAKNTNLFLLQLLESLIYSLISLYFAGLVFKFFMPSFYFLMGKSSSDFDSIFSPFLIWLIIGILIISTISGIYPYVRLKLKTYMLFKYQWQWKPLFHSGKTIGINKTMTAIQYISSIILISIIIIVTKQINFFMDNRLGKGQDKIICLKNVPVQVINKYQVLKSQLLANPVINGVTSSFEEPADEANDYMDFNTTGTKNKNKDKMLAVYPADDNFFKFYNVKFLAGNDFPAYNGNDSLSENYILNKKALDYLGWTVEEAIGRDFSLVFNTSYGTNLFNGGKIIGIVENFQMSSMKDEIKPFVFFQKSFWLGSIQLKYHSEVTSIDSVLSAIKKIWENIYIGFPFEYEFVEDMYESIYINEIRLQKISILIGIVAIIMSCLGLWAITGITYQIKTKEVGIRKANGASSKNILFWFLKDIIIMIILSSIIAFPIAFYIMQKWLENYAYKIKLSWWIFVLSGTVTLAIALLTVIWQSLHIANKNPVEALRYE